MRSAGCGVRSAECGVRVPSAWCRGLGHGAKTQIGDQVPYLMIYVAGVALGLAVMRDPWPSRLLTALVWPLGPVAFVIVSSILIIAAAVLWPMQILGSVAIFGAIAWLLL